MRTLDHSEYLYPSKIIFPLSPVKTTVADLVDLK